MNHEQLRELERLLPNAEIVDATPLMQTVRMLKSAAEIGRLERAAEISAIGVEAGWRALRPAMTEREILQVIGAAMFAAGAEVGTKPSFFGILAGDRWHLANAVASDYGVQQGDFVLVDGGASYRGYVCDFIRQASLGEPSQERRRWYTATLKATEAAIATIKPGVEAREVYDAALHSLGESGLAEYNRMNIIGHGIGADVHELPWLGDETVFTADTILREGMVLCVEPGTLPPAKDDLRGHFIVEEIVEVTTTGTRLLTSRLDKDLWIA
jgi:Xaa-Pro dipeptidase